MGLKSVELQVAIPRTQDAGKMQEQLSRQGQQFQETLAQQKLQEELAQRRRVNEYEKTRKKNDKKQSHDELDKNNKEDARQYEPHQENEYSHPYLGKQVDFTR